jgi:hypothetical protein
MLICQFHVPNHSAIDHDDDKDSFLVLSWCTLDIDMPVSCTTCQFRAFSRALRATERCTLLSGTPAFVRPMELWPQLTILGMEQDGWWQHEGDFIRKYVQNP